MRRARVQERDCNVRFSLSGHFPCVWEGLFAILSSIDVSSKGPRHDMGPVPFRTRAYYYLDLMMELKLRFLKVTILVITVVKTSVVEYSLELLPKLHTLNLRYVTSSHSRCPHSILVQLLPVPRAI